MEREFTQGSERGRDRLRYYEMALNTAVEEFARPLDLIEWNRCFLQDHLKHSGKEYSAQQVEESLQDIHAAVTRMNRLIDHLAQICTSLCGCVPVQEAALDLASFLRSICADNDAIYRAIGVRLTLEYEPGNLWSVVADPALAERVLLHLLGCGLRVCGPGEELSFRLSRRRGEILLTVEDNGSGMMQEPFLCPSGETAVCSGEVAPAAGRMGISSILFAEYCRMLGWKIELPAQKDGRKIIVVIPERWDKAAQICLNSPVAGRQEVSRFALLQTLRSVPGLENLSLEAEEQ